MTQQTAMPLPLEGIRIVSFAQLLQGPSGVQMLADLGADVIKVERPGKGAWERGWSGGETYLNGVSMFFLLANRNQESITINLKSKEGREIVYRLIENADILVENFRPDVMERLSLGYPELERRNPRLIYCSCTGYGNDGPYKNRPGQDLLLQALSGLAAMTGPDGHPPVPVGAAIVDQHSAVLLAMAIMAAVLQRQMTGKGQKIDVNLLNAALDMQIEPLGYFLNGGDVYQRSRSGLGTPYHEPPYGIYKTADGYIAISLTPLGKLADVLDIPELVKWEGENHFENRDEINEVIKQAVLSHPTSKLLILFEAADIWCAQVNTYENLFDDAQVMHNDVIETFEYPGVGEVRVLKHPVKYSRIQPKIRRQPPTLGENTDTILRQLGYGDADIQELRNKGVL